MAEIRYFDYNATTPLAEVARSAWLAANDSYWLNASSPYRAASAVRVRLEAARSELAARFGVPAERIIYTSGATEANNAVIRHWSHSLDSALKVGVNPTEHPSVIEPAKALLGGQIEWLPIDASGRVDLDALEALLSSGSLGAVSVMAANNETGVLQPWSEIAAFCRRFEVPFHCDASQWVGKLPIDGLSACTYVTACGHKFGGPKGIGFLILPDAQDVCRLLHGGVQEGGHRAGTEDLSSALAMNAALEVATCAAARLRDEFIDAVRVALPDVVVVGEGAPRLWNTVLLIMPKHSSVRWIRLLERAGFLVSAGSACSTGKSSRSDVLLSLGLSEAAAGRVLRISSWSCTTPDDWATLAAAIVDASEQMDADAAEPSGRVIQID